MKRNWRQIHLATAILAAGLSILSAFICGRAQGQKGHATAEPFDSIFRDGVASFRAGNLQSAEQDFRRAITLKPDFAEAYMNLALVEERLGNTSAEIEALDTALRLKPGLRGANLFLGVALYHQDKFEAARQALNREIRVTPGDSHALMWLGIVDDACNDPETAVNVLDEAARLAPKDIDILYNRGRAALLLSQKSYEQMFKVNPDSWRVHQVLAQAFSESDRHTQAIAEYQKAIKDAPNEPELHESLGNEYWRGSQLDQARAEFEREVKLDPDNPMALYYLGSIQIEESDPADAIASLQKALSIDPKMADACYYLGRGDLAVGKTEDAVIYLQRAIQMTTEAGTGGTDLMRRSWYQIALAYRRLHETDKAQAAFAEFQKLQQKMDTSSSKSLEEIKKQHQELDRDIPSGPTPKN